MHFVSCGKGHYYNPEEYGSCPQCARERTMQGRGLSLDSIGSTVPTHPPVGGLSATAPVGSISATVPVGNIGPTVPVDGISPTVPVEPIGATVPVDSFSQGYAPTTFVSPEFTGGEAGPRQPRTPPVVGWLVCVEGAAKGQDFRIHSQYNYIGRARHMDICIEGDDSISSEKAAILAYDDQQRSFFFAPGQGRNLVRINGRAVLNTAELQAYDRLTIGKSTLLFIPLCGERFDWNGENT